MRTQKDQLIQDVVDETNHNLMRSLTISPKCYTGSPTQYFNSPQNGCGSPLNQRHKAQSCFSSEKIIIGSDKNHGANDQLSDKSDEETNTKAVQNFLSIFREFRIKRRMKEFLAEIPSRRYKQLTKRQFGILQDVTSHYKVSRQQIHAQNQASLARSTSKVADSSIIFTKNNQQIGLLQENLFKRIQTFVKRCCECLVKYVIYKYKINKILHKIPLFDYQSNKKLFWDTLYCVCSLMFYFSIPLHISLNLRISKIIPINFLIFSWFIILLHIIFTLNTCYFEKGLLVNQRQKILRHYIEKTLLTDLFSFLPLTIIMGREINSNPYGGDDPLQIILSFLFIFKILQFQKVIIGIEERFHLSNRINYIIQLRRINATNHRNSWLITRGVENETWELQYLQGFYFITVTMISVGYGDIVPQSSSEIILCIVIMFISCFVFAYSVNMIGDIINNIYMQDNLVKNKIRIIGNFMAKNNINQNLRQQIRIYLEYYQRQFSEQNEKEEQKVIGHLSENLKNSLMIEANKFILRESPIFSKYFSEGVIEKMVSIIKEYRSTPEQLKIFFIWQVIYQRNMDHENPKIYFIKSGVVEIYASRIANKQQQVHLMQKTPIKVLKQGESFGEYQFFTGNSNSYSARSLEFSRILYINRRDFLDLLKQYPLDYEKFCYIKDKMTFQSDASGINLKCYICDSQKHLVEKCAITHYIEDVYKIIRRQQRSIPVQERQEFQRSSQKIHWHQILDEIREHAWQLQDDNESYIENASWMSGDSDSYIPSDDENLINLQEEQNQKNTGQNITPNSSFVSNNLNQSQKQIRNHLTNHDFENLVHERQQTDRLKEQRRFINMRSLNYDSNNSSPGDQMKIQKISNSMLASKHPQPIRKSQMLNQQPLIIENKTEEQPIKAFEKKETLHSQKKKQQRQHSACEQIFVSSPRDGTQNTTPPQNQQNENLRDSQIKQLKQSGKSDLNSLQNQETIKSIQLDIIQNNNLKQSQKLLKNQNLGSHSPSNIKYNQNTRQSQMMCGGTQINKLGMLPQQVVANLQSLTAQQIQQGLSGNPQTINIAEIIGNQLMMNNKNNYMGKVNEENTFDIKKIYEFYYKHNNYSNVLKNYNKPILRLIKLLQKNRIKKRKDQSIVKQNSNSIIIPGKKGSYIDRKEEKESPKKSFFNKGQINDLVSDSIIQSALHATQNKLPSTQQLIVNKKNQSEYQSLNTSNMPLSPTSPNISFQTNKYGKSFINPFNQAAEKNFDDTSMASLLNNNKLTTISAEEFNLNKVTQNTQYYETVQNTQTQNDQYSNTNDKNNISKQVQMYIQDLKQNKPHSFVMQQTEQQQEANGFKIKFSALQEQLDDENQIENNDIKRQMVFKQRQSYFITLPTKEQKINSYTNDIDSNIMPIQEKTSENIHTSLKINQDKDILSSKTIKQTTDRQKRSTEEQLVINNTQFEEDYNILNIQSQNTSDNNNQLFKIKNDSQLSQMQYLKVDTPQSIDLNQKQNSKSEKLEKIQRQSLSLQKEQSDKYYDRKTSIEQSIQQPQNQEKSLKKSEKSTGQQLQIIGEEKHTFSKQPSFNFTSGKKQSIRRYSRAYNMALQKRSSSIQQQPMDLNIQNEVNNKQQSISNQKSNRSISSSSSSSKSYEVSSNKKEYLPYANIQINDFKFDLD